MPRAGGAEPHPIHPREGAARARLCGGGVPRGPSWPALPARRPSLSSSPPPRTSAGREVNGPGREMGPDSSPKKLSLKEQRAAYLQWFALADEGLLSRRDATRPPPSLSNSLSRLADECVSLSFFLFDGTCTGTAPRRRWPSDGERCAQVLRHVQPLQARAEAGELTSPFVLLHHISAETRRDHLRFCMHACKHRQTLTPFLGSYAGSSMSDASASLH